MSRSESVPEAAMSNGKSGQTTVDRLKEFLRQDPENWNLRADLFDAALAAGDVAAATEQVERARTARPDDPAWSHREATLLLATRRYPEAQVVLEHLIAAGNDHPAVRHNLAYALFAEGRLEDAAAAVEPLLGLAEESGGLAWVLWLRAQHRLHRADQALARLGDEAAQRPMAPEAWGVASLMAIDENRLPDAAAWSERALRGRPDQLEALVARGTVALAHQDPKGALGLFERALRLHPTDGRTWSGVALARMLAMDLPGALDAFQKAVATMPDHVGTWIAYGWGRLMGNDVAGARAAFEEAVRLDRNFGESHGALAVALARQGDTARARAEIDVALRLDRLGLSARYAEAVLSGEVKDAEAFARLARRVLGQVPAPEGGAGGTLADIVFGARRSRDAASKP